MTQFPSDLFITPGQPCDEARVRQIERNLGVELPERYRELIMATGCGNVAEKYAYSRRYCGKDGTDFGGVKTLCGNGPNPHSAFRFDVDGDALKTARKWEYPQWGVLIGFGYGSAHTPLLLNVSNPAYPEGAVVHLDVEVGEETCIFDSFDEFFEDLVDPFEPEGFEPSELDRSKVRAIKEPGMDNAVKEPSEGHASSPAREVVHPNPDAGGGFSIIVSEPVGEKLLLPSIERRLLLPPRSTPALDAFAEQVEDKFITSIEVAGDGLLGLMVDFPSPSPIATRISPVALANGVALAVPEWNYVRTRGNEVDTYRLRTRVSEFEYASAELVDEALDFIVRISIPDGYDNFIVVAERTGDERWGEEEKTPFIRARWEFENGDWAVEYRDARKQQFFTFTPSVDEVARLVKHWLATGGDVAGEADWQRLN